MFVWTKTLGLDKNKNPFMKKIDSLSAVQARMYTEGDKLMAEEQWAQVTVKMNGQNH